MSNIFKPSRDLEPDTACARYLSQAKGWVRDCCEKHDRCKERPSSTLPTRVLDVSFNNDFVFLRESAKTEEGSYVALSHVWGGIVPIRTTAKTIALFKDGIHLGALPQTFRDAVFIARYLECRYLWIDSLCIVQDSKEDWAKEAARMAQVYGNALVTLAAVNSANSNGGLFSKHDANTVKHTIRRVEGNGIEITVKVRPALDHTPYFTSAPRGLPPGVGASLLGRAWCYQGKLHSKASRNPLGLVADNNSKNTCCRLESCFSPSGKSCGCAASERGATVGISARTHAALSSKALSRSGSTKPFKMARL